MKTLYNFSLNDALAQKPFSADYVDPLSLELAFTAHYQQHQHDPAPLREAHSVKFLLPHMFQPVEEGDLFAGRIRYPLVAFGPEPAGLGYSCRTHDIRKLMDTLAITGEKRLAVEAMLAFWAAENTETKCRQAYPPHIQRVLPTDAWTEESGVAFPLYRMGGSTLDYAKLMRLGVPGLRQEIAAKSRGATEEAQVLYQAMHGPGCAVRSCRWLAKTASQCDGPGCWT